MSPRLSQPRSAVLNSVTGQSLTFFDSSGYARVSLTSCRSTAKQPRTARRAYFIEPKGIFLVQVKLK